MHVRKSAEVWTPMLAYARDVESGRSHQGGQRLFIRDCNMKPDLLGERERVSGKFHWAQTAANRHGFLMKTCRHN